MKALHVHIDDKLHQWLKIEAARRGVSLRELVVEALEQLQKGK